MYRDLLIEYLKTPAGCDGGNINGNNWLFSIEYGGEAHVSDYENLVVDNNHSSISENEIAKFIDGYPFNQRIAKFEAVKHGHKIEEYLSFSVKEKIFSSSSEYYKGNIGGLQFKHDDHGSFEEIGKILNIRTKDELKQIEIECRANMFQEWVLKNSPTSLCCFGTTDSKRFIQAFSDIDDNPSKWKKLDGFYYYHDIVNKGKTNLFILPHLTAKYGQGLTKE